MERKVVQLSEDIARGTVDETKAVGILEQWMIEGKLEPEEALTQACDLLSVGLDTVSIIICTYVIGCGRSYVSIVYIIPRDHSSIENGT